MEILNEAIRLLRKAPAREWTTIKSKRVGKQLGNWSSDWVDNEFNLMHISGLDIVYSRLKEFYSPHKITVLVGVFHQNVKFTPKGWWQRRRLLKAINKNLARQAKERAENGKLKCPHCGLDVFGGSD